jgi:hypothetical protein
MRTATRLVLSMVAGMCIIGCGFLPVAPEPPALAADEDARLRPNGDGAPEACGFPPGTALEFAGRATTAGPGVQEVRGDPMSNDPADIYVTRDAFDQGELRGRLVCAIYVNPPGFVEITVHPDDVEPPVDEPALPRGGPPEAPAGAISEERAVAIAREAVLEQTDGDLGLRDPLAAIVGWEFGGAEAGPLDQMLFEGMVPEWARELPEDRWVWRVYLVRGDRGMHVFLDAVDAKVYGTLLLILN